MGPVERYDQRDPPNARILLKPGIAEYEDYYSRHPEFREWYDENRRPPLNSVRLILFAHRWGVKLSAKFRPA